MRALVLGKGLSGQAAAALLVREGAEVIVLDGDDAFPEGVVDLVVTSPGIALDHVWQQTARARGIPVLSELQLGVMRYRAAGGRLLAVTGSKGKSSVVKLVADTLNRTGRPAVACGNYGTPLCAICNAHLFPTSSPSSPLHSSLSPIPSLPWAVVEVSSFQLETTTLPSDAFVAAALLNLQDDHLDRHGTRAVYHALKRQLLTYAERPYDFSDVCAEGVPAEMREAMAGSYFDNEILLPNGAAAAALLAAAGLSRDEIAAGFRAFAPLPHRMAEVAVVRGVRYVDDSKATSLAALAAGVRMAQGGMTSKKEDSRPKCRLIAGGLSKGDDPNFAIPLLQSGVKKVYLIGRCAEQFFESWFRAVPCELCGTLERAVESARRDAETGETVLLSPGTASFDQFKSYSERGDAFAALVKQGTKNEG